MKAIVLGLFAALLVAAPAWADKLKVGLPAPPFEVTTFDGRKLTQDDFRGQVVVLNFWATWCAPCRKELPLLSGYYEIQRTHGLAVLAVTTEDSVSPSKLAPLAKVVAFPLASHMKGKFHVMEGVPTNYVIDRAGVLRYAKAGAFDLDALNELLVPLLKEPAPEAAPTRIAAR